MFKKMLCSTSLVLIAPFATAETYTVVKAGIDFGGSQIDKVYFFTAGDSDGTPSGYHEITAGGLWHIAIGKGFTINDKINAEITAGYKFDFATADAGGSAAGVTEFDYGFHRFPIEFGLQYKTNNRTRFGAGITYHLNPEVDGERQFDGTTELENKIPYDDALGLFGEYAYNVYPSTDVGLRYTAISYERSGTNPSTGNTQNVSADANSFGLFITYRK